VLKVTNFLVREHGFLISVPSAMSVLQKLGLFAFVIVCLKVSGKLTIAHLTNGDVHWSGGFGNDWEGGKDKLLPFGSWVHFSLWKCL
jgi:hypothetical protein